MIHSGSQKRKKRPKYYQSYGGPSGSMIGHGTGSSSSNQVLNGPRELNEANDDYFFEDEENFEEEMRASTDNNNYEDDADDGAADIRDSEIFNATAFEAVGFSAFVRSELNEEGAEVNYEENCLIQAARRASRGNTDDDSANEDGDIAAPTLHFEAYTSNKRGQCFNIARDYLLEILTQMNAPLPANDHTPVLLGYEETIGDLARELCDFFSFNSIRPAGEAQLFKILRKYIPPANWPMATTKGGNYKSILHKYNVTGFIMLDFDICRNNCGAFVGNCANSFTCAFCQGERFSHCTHSRCIVAHLPKVRCNHKSNRMPFKHLYYRPIIPLIKYLLELPGFLDAINYKYHKLDGFGDICDVSDGPVYKQNMADMVAKFKEKSNPGDVMVNLLTSLFYDGVQVHKYIYSEFWPLVLFILNLPPNYRNKTGIGAFVLSVFNSQLGSGAETFLFSQCLIDELLVLYHGVTITIGRTSYFVQLRSILNMWDLKALEKALCVAIVNGYDGCPFCNMCTGVRRSDSIAQITYPFQRCFLDDDCWLRTLGKTKNCCPEHHYLQERDPRMANPTKPNPVQNPIQNAQRMAAYREGLRVAFETRKAALCGETKQLVHPCDRNNDQARVFRNTVLKQLKTFAFDNIVTRDEIENVHQFLHCDYRAKKEVHRTTQQDYCEAYEAFIAQCNGKDAVRCVKGMTLFKELPYFGFDLQNYDFFHALMDVIANAFDLLKGDRPINLTKMRAYAEQTGTFMWYLKVTPAMMEQEKADTANKKANDDEIGSATKENTATAKTRTSKPTAAQIALEKEEAAKRRRQSVISIGVPYVLSAEDQNRLDALCHCMRSGKGYSQDHSVSMIMRRTGMLKGAQLIFIMTSLMDFLLSNTSLAAGYKAYFHCMSFTFINLLSPIQSSADLDSLEEQLKQLHAMHCGLFPPTENIFMWHTLICGVQRLRQYGPAHCSWTLGGERSMPGLKNRVKAGRNFVKTVMKSFLAAEQGVTSRAYGVNKGTIKLNQANSGRNSRADSVQKSINPVGVITVTATGELVYNDYSLLLLKEIHGSGLEGKNGYAFNDLELDWLLKAMILEIRKQTDNAEDALSQSRLFCLHTLYQQSKTMRDRYTFWNFLKCGNYPRNREHFEPIECLVQNSTLCTMADFAIVDDLFQTSQWRVFQDAVVFGKIFHGRGVAYVEDEDAICPYKYGAQKSANFPQKDVNNIRFTAMHARQHAWAKIRSRPTEDKKNHGLPENMSIIFGQVNFFVRAVLPGELLLHGVPFASIVARSQATERKHRYCYEIDCSNDSTSYIADTRFVAATDFFSTPLIILPIDSQLYPITSDDELGLDVVFRPLVSKNKPIDRLIMLEGAPARYRVRYEPGSNAIYNKFEGQLLLFSLLQTI